MGFSKEDIQASRNYFLEKLRSEKQQNDVLKAVEGNAPFDFVLLDTRGREAFANGHIPGAWSVDETEVDRSRGVTAEGQGDGYVLLGARLTTLRQDGSAVGRARIFRKRVERRFERMDLQPAPHASGKAREQRTLQLQ
jgi:rhodanese-related sulfurtransferase